ncbi:MAG: iron-containing alcohol dehydrogenase [Balneolales bacterium]|nr:iron-containing alcohol dehydrogenase [Balneolales bacterium]
MKDFDLHIQTRLLFGSGKEKNFYDHVLSIGKKIFIVIGGGSVKKLGYLDRITRGLEKGNAEILLFEGIEPNPTSGTINKAAKKATEFKAEVILALGGGSVMDASKAIAGLVYAGEEDIWPYVLGGSKMNKMKGVVPIATIPTTAATASEVTPYAVISNPETNGKAPIGYPFMRPTVSWLNPEFTLELPPTTTRDGASDILSHVFENYLLGGNQSPLADRYAEGVIATVIETLPLVIAEPDNYELRARLLWASNLALNGYQQAGREPSGFVMHAIEHAISGFYHNIAHGRGLATIYPAYFRWLWKHDRCRDRMAQLGERIFGIDKDDVSFASLTFINRFEEWLKSNDLFQSLSDLGVEEEKFEAIAQYTIDTYGFGKNMDARGPLTKDNIIEIMKMTEKVKATT